MTTSHPAVTEVPDHLKQITDCNICRKTFTDPRILPCIHTFCLSCIHQEGTEANKRSGEKMPCPLCRKEFTIPMSGFEGLEKSFFTQRMVEMRRLLERTSGRIPCDVCNDETANESNALAFAESHCPECSLNFCGQCCAHHLKNRLTREHSLREGASLTDAREPEEMLQARMCRGHKEEMKLYCDKCSDVLCSMCFIENHQGHKRLSVAEAGDNFRKEIQVSINDIDECTSKATIKKELIEREMERMIECTERLEKEVMKRRDDLKELVDKHAANILVQLQTRKSEKIKEVAVQQVETEAHLSSLESYKDYSSSFVVYGTNGEICKNASGLKARAIELLKENDAAVRRQLLPCQLSFTASTLDKFFNFAENLIGNIKDSDNEEPEPMPEGNTTDENIDTSDVIQTQSEQHAAECETDIKAQEFEKRSTTQSADEKGNKEGKKTSLRNPVLVKTLKTHVSEEENRPIWGVTCLNNELYIVTKGSSLVEVYDLVSLDFTRKWDLNKLQDPQDITSCAKNKCLYVMDWNLAMILKVDPNGLIITEWSVAKGKGRLSVTHESNVLFTAYNQNKLSEYRADGRLIRDIKLSSEDGIVHPQHALKLANGGFVVSHGVMTDPLHRVCVIDGSGEVLKSIGGKPGSTVERVNIPLHLAFNSDGCILVADWNNCRVLLLNSQLEFKRELLSKRDGLRFPGRICLNEANDRLIVADNLSGWNDGQVRIFNI